MRHLHFGKLFFVVFSLLLACTVSARKPIKTLLITGQNNHNWQVSHVVLKQILENSGRFDVDFAISPEQGKDMSGFVLDFSPVSYTHLGASPERRHLIRSRVHR